MPKLVQTARTPTARQQEETIEMDRVDFEPQNVIDRGNRDDVENRQGYSNMHLHDYKTKLGKDNEKLYSRAESEFLVKPDIKEDIKNMKRPEMETVNLFGLPLDQAGNFDAEAANQDLAAAIQSLMSQAIGDDPQGTYMDYTHRKSYATYDPYDDQVYFAALKYEDQAKNRASLIVNAQSAAL